MKKYSKIFLLGLTAILFSCADEFVDTTPTDNIPGENIIIDEASAESALNGLYSGLQLSRVYGGYDTFYTGLYADEMSHTGSFPSFAELGGNDPALNNVEIVNYWNQHYSAIYRANLIINTVESAELGLNEDAVLRIAGQAKGIRALVYYKLVKVFGGVPLIFDAFTSPDDIDQNPTPRSSVSEVYSQILTDVNSAISDVPEGLDYYRFNHNAALMLLAKVQMELGNYTDAEATLEPIIGEYSLENSYQSLFGTNGLTASSQETIFAVDFSDTDGGNHAFFNLISAKGGRGEVAASAALINEFEDGDERSILITAQNEIGKYTQPGTGNDDAYVFRYADALLMYAELLARRDDPDASDYINEVRDRANLGGVTLNSSNFVELIAHERFVEFFGESSDRLFTITRLGIADEVIENKPNNVFIAERNNLWPIPQQEIERNSAITVDDQNPGY
ncbi:RagB/SusD family nutrient uptake outer membrane protein [Sinomicrobium oceani]|nr:RagB/SusD family nutrient uptake outer membrane protein [Sinomicrobium oceani]